MSVVDVSDSRFGLGIDMGTEVALLMAHIENQQARTGMPPHAVAMTIGQYHAIAPFIDTGERPPMILGLPIGFR